jgi:hypothetical protein
MTTVQIKPEGQVFFYICNMVKTRVGISLTGLALPHFCAYPVTGLGFPMHMSWAFFFCVQ